MKRIVLAILLLSLPLAAGDKLDQVLTHMDATAARFHAVTAHLTYTRFTAIVNDKTTETGTISFQKEKDGSFKIHMEFGAPDARTVLLRDGKARIYRPKIAEIQEFEIGRNRDMMEQFLLLGFGGGGHNLLKSYSVTLEGDDKLVLIPKGSAASQLKKVELSLSRDTWQPAQQVFTEPNGNTLTAKYQDLKESPGLPDSSFKINAPPGVKTVKPGS